MDELYAFWLQLACGICNSVYLKLFTRFPSFREIYECEDFSFLNGKYSCERSLRKKDLDEAYELQKRCRSQNIQVITYYDPRYPNLLKWIQAPPAILYCIGDLRDLNQLVGVAVVGTRSMTSYGAKVAEDFAFYLTLCGATVISGLAKGIDTCAHRGAVRADGYTIGVLGTPIDEIYPKENARAFQTLYRRGLVISEMYPGCRRSRGDFPNRNRIISGLSEATLIVEAGEHSGALITARHAIYQNKLVYAVPGALGDAHAGTNLLIKQGVRAATSAEDILKELALSHPTKIYPEHILSTPRIYAYGNAMTQTRESFGDIPEREDVYTGTVGKTKTVKKADLPSSEIRNIAAAQDAGKPVSGMSETVADKIRHALSRKPLTADELAEETGIGVTALLAELTILEIEGVVQASAGNRFLYKK